MPRVALTIVVSDNDTGYIRNRDEAAVATAGCTDYLYGIVIGVVIAINLILDTASPKSCLCHGTKCERQQQGQQGHSEVIVGMFHVSKQCVGFYDKGGIPSMAWAHPRQWVNR